MQAIISDLESEVSPGFHGEKHSKSGMKTEQLDQSFRKNWLKRQHAVPVRKFHSISFVGTRHYIFICESI